MGLDASLTEVESLSLVGRRKLIKAKNRERLWRNWGYILLPITLWAWFIAQLAPATITIMATLSFGFFLFQAQAPCCAQTRKGEWCRNNSWGILGGCHYKQHRLQNIKMLIDSATRQRAINGILRGVDGKTAVVAATISFCSLLVSFATLLLNMSKA
jgi:hypothetical protein